MGVCQSDNKADKKRFSQVKGNTDTKIQDANIESSFNYGRQQKLKSNKDFLQLYLETGDVQRVADIIDKNEFDINEYIFDSNKTALHIAAQQKNPKLISYLLLHGANIDKIEKETGNTALIFASLDLNVEVVKELLKYNPNINILNKSEKNIFDVLNDTFVTNSSKKVTKHYAKKSALTEEEKRNLNIITNLLQESNYKLTAVETNEAESHYKNEAEIIHNN